MSNSNTAKKFGGSPEFQDAPLLCFTCGTGDFLTVESIQPCVPSAPGWVAVEYSCGNCEAYFAHNATVENVATILATTLGPGGVLRFGYFYIHCGEPMELKDFRLSSLKIARGDLVDAPVVKVATKVLRCRCGFQISVPTAGRSC